MEIMQVGWWALSIGVQKLCTKEQVTVFEFVTSDFQQNPFLKSVYRQEVVRRTLGKLVIFHL